MPLLSIQRLLAQMCSSFERLQLKVKHIQEKYKIVYFIVYCDLRIKMLMTHLLCISIKWIFTLQKSMIFSSYNSTKQRKKIILTNNDLWHKDFFSVQLKFSTLVIQMIHDFFPHKTTDTGFNFINNYKHKRTTQNTKMDKLCCKFIQISSESHL